MSTTTNSIMGAAATIVVAALSPFAVLASSSALGCPAGTTAVGSTSGEAALTVCEALSERSSGSLHFVDPTGAVQTTIDKRYVPIFVDESTLWLGLNKTTVHNSVSDILGHTLLSQAGAIGEPTLSAVMGLAAPMRYDGGYNKQDPAHGGRMVVGGGHTFTGSRAANVDAVFDYLGGDTRQNGYPSMDQWPGKYKRSKAIFKDPIAENKTLEGLWGGHLPIISFTYQIEGGWIEWTAVPCEDTEGSIEQRVMFRIVKMAEDGTKRDARYFDTYAYNAADDIFGIPARGQTTGSKTAAAFYDAVLASERFWNATFVEEGTMEFDLPGASASESAAAPAGSPINVTTDGELLSQQALHSIVRDMITRTGGSGTNGTGFFPKYGVTNIYGELSGDGFEDIFRGSLTMALETGSNRYAEGVLQNWLTHYLRVEDNNGVAYSAVNYRGPEMPHHGRQLTLMALYYSYTGDPSGLLLRHYDKIQGLVNLLRHLRSKAQQRNATDPAYGMPAGNDEADLFQDCIECGTTYGASPGDCVTALPYISIAAEMARGFMELGEVLQTIGAGANRPEVTSEGAAMVKEAAELRADMETQLTKSTLQTPQGVCHPHVFGWNCNIVNGGFHPRPVNEPHYQMPTFDVFAQGRTYPEAFESGLLPETVVKGIVKYHSDNLGLLTLPEHGELCPFNSHGWGFGLLQHDLIPEFLIYTFGMSAHAYTRGTWTAAECMSLDADQSATGYATPSQTIVPIMLKWMMVFEDPVTQTVWLGKGLPRVWLAAGSRGAGVQRAPTRYGRISWSIKPDATDASKLTASISLHSAATKSWPNGGIRLRVRSPGFATAGKHISSVYVGGKSWSHFNATVETVDFLDRPHDMSALANITVKLARLP